MDARSIAELISAEHSQIISLVLSYLEYDLAAEVLSLLPVELQPEIITRIATLETVQPDALLNLQEILQKKFKENSSVKATKIGGIEAAAKIINFSNNTIEKKILDGCMVERPGWIRMSIHPTITNKEVLYVCESIKQVAENYKEWEADYEYNAGKNEFVHKTATPIENKIVNNWFNS